MLSGLVGILMAIYTIIGLAPNGDQVLRYNISGDSIQDALDTLDEHVRINGSRQLNTTTINDGTAVKVRGNFRDENNQLMSITIYENQITP